MKHHRSLLLFLPILLIANGPAWVEVCQGSRVPKAQRLLFDQEINLTAAEIAQAKAEHAPWGVPACPKLLPHREYLVCYDLDQLTPQWAMYKLTRNDLGLAPRRDALRTDPRLTDDEPLSHVLYLIEETLLEVEVRVERLRWAPG